MKKPPEVVACDVIAVRLVVKQVYKPFISANLPYILCESQGYGDLKIRPDCVIEVLDHVPSPEEREQKLRAENDELRRKYDELLKVNTELLAKQVQDTLTRGLKS